MICQYDLGGGGTVQNGSLPGMRTAGLQRIARKCLEKLVLGVEVAP